MAKAPPTPSRFTETQKRAILAECDKSTMSAVAEKHGISNSTLHVWKSRLLPKKSKRKLNGKQNGSAHSVIPTAPVSIEEEVTPVKRTIVSIPPPAETVVVNRRRTPTYEELTSENRRLRIALEALITATA